MDVEGGAVQKASIVLLHKGKLVLVEREAWDLDPSGEKTRVVWWELPGGKADHPHESARRVAVREAREETGARLKCGEVVFLGIGAHPKNGGRLTAIFECTHCSGKIHNASPNEHLRVREFSPKELRRLDLTADVRIPHWVFEQFTQTGEVHSGSMDIRLS
jgi:8-oxo-dGTP pyrophosphatase MutT (NUDIX family)